MRKGTQHSEETKAKIAAAKLGKTFTPEHSKAISEALKGQKKSLAHRKAIGEGIRKAKLAHKADVIIEKEVLIKESNTVI